MTFFSRPQSFGLDISDFSLKFVQLKRTKNGLKLSSFGEADIPSGVIENEEVKNESALAEIIKSALANADGEKLKTNNVILSLPEEKSFLDVISLPATSQQELPDAVRFEAENHIPHRLEDVYFDFEKVQSVYEQKNYQEVLIAAIPKHIADGYLRALEMSGLSARALEIECLAIVRALIKAATVANPVLIIDFGASRSTFIVYSGTSIRFTSSIPFSSSELTKKLAARLTLKNKEAEKIKLREGLEGRKEVAKILKAGLEKFVEKIKNCLEYYHSHEAEDQLLHDGKIPEKILLCGGGVNMKGLPEFLSSRLEVKVELGNPWVNILKQPLREVPELSFERALGYTTALGLALRGLEKESSKNQIDN